MTREVFVDTSYLVAIVNPRDTLHAAARRLNRSVRRVRFVTKDLVLVELLSYYAASDFFRLAAGRSVAKLRAAPSTTSSNSTAPASTPPSRQASQVFYQLRAKPVVVSEPVFRATAGAEFDAW